MKPPKKNVYCGSRCGRIVATLALVCAYGYGGMLDAAALDDATIKKLRQTRTTSKKVQRTVKKVSSDVDQLIEIMRLSGVLDKKTIGSADDILSDLNRATDEDLKATLEYLAIAQNSQDISTVIKAKEATLLAIKKLEDAKEKAQQKAKRVKVAEKIKGIRSSLKKLQQETLEESKKELEGEETDAEKREELSQEQEKIADQLEKLEKDIENLENPNEEDADKEDASEENTEDLKEGLDEDAREIAEELEDGDLNDAADEQQDLLDELSDLADGLAPEGSEDASESEDEGDESEGNEQDLDDTEDSEGDEQGNDDMAEFDAEALQEALEDLASDIEEQNENIDDFESENDFQGDEFEDMEEFDELLSEQFEIEQQLGDFESLESEDLDAAMEALKQAQQEMQDGNFEKAQELNKEAMEALKKAAEQAAELAEQQNGEQGEPMPPGENGEPQPPGAPLPPSPSGPPEPPQPGSPNTQEQPPQQVQGQTQPPGPESKVPSFYINQMHKKVYGKIGKNWNGYFKKSRRIIMMQDSQEQTPPEYENQTKKYFKAISEAAKE